MATNHEIEPRQMMTASIYNRLQKKYFKGSVLFKQVNYYIDTPDFELKEHRSALHIRVKDNQHEMTLETPAEVDLLEYNYIVDIKPEMDSIISNDNFPGDTRQIIAEQFGVKDTTLLILSILTAYRQETRCEGDLLVLDKNEYFDTTDYESELEARDYNQGLQEFQPLLNELNLEHHQPLNKV